MPDRIYCYPDSDVLKNKMGVRDSERLSQLERRLTMLRLLELIDKPIRGKFDLKHLQAIHKCIFQDIYEWAGEIRKVDIAKGNMFCNIRFLPGQAAEIFGNITDDVVFEIELIRQIEINIDYILMLVKKYHDTHCEDKEVLITIHKAIDAGPELRSKKQLIENFIAGINDVDDAMNEWHNYVVEQKAHDLDEIIAEEKLKPEDTLKFMENAFRDGEIKTSGTDIDKLMPPISRFGGGGRAKKKQGVIDKLKTFFEKYFGIGGPASFTGQEYKMITYDFNRQEPLPMVAESKTPYGENYKKNTVMRQNIQK